MKVFLVSLLTLTSTFATSFADIPNEVLLSKFSLFELSTLSLVDKRLREKISKRLLNDPYLHLNKLILEFNLSQALPEYNPRDFASLDERNLPLRSIQILGKWHLRCSGYREWSEKLQNVCKSILFGIAESKPSAQKIARITLLLWDFGLLSICSEFLNAFRNSEISFSEVILYVVRRSKVVQLGDLIPILQKFENLTDKSFVHAVLENGILVGRFKYESTYCQLFDTQLSGKNKLDISKWLKVIMLDSRYFRIASSPQCQSMNFEYGRCAIFLIKEKLCKKKSLKSSCLQSIEANNFSEHKTVELNNGMLTFHYSCLDEVDISEKLSFFQELFGFEKSPHYNPLVHKSHPFLFDFFYWYSQNSATMETLGKKAPFQLISFLGDLTQNDCEILKYAFSLGDIRTIGLAFSGFNELIFACLTDCLKQANLVLKDQIITEFHRRDWIFIPNHLLQKIL